MRYYNRRFVLRSGIAIITGYWATSQYATQAAENTVSVSTAEEFARAIAPNRTIELNPGAYILSDLVDRDLGEYARFNSVFDGEEIVISGVENLKIIGLGDRPPQILTRPRYADVLSFVNCQNIAIENIESGHSPEPGSCTGSVLSFDNCQGIDIDRCILFGSGMMGIDAKQTQNLTCRNTTIHGCTYYILAFYRVQNSKFESCEFYDNERYKMVVLRDSSNIEFDRCEFRNNQVIWDTSWTSIDPDDYAFFAVVNSSSIVVRESQFQGNRAPYFVSDVNAIEFIDTTFTDNDFPDNFPILQ
ncbi:MAG: right-handed parallel beta-helix repeat-containing protein [Cyanobacteriota bacterium]|nr:right-handed parallel beta-helix repeat-containing protein [Cyanobacteriota bacterium]